MEFDRSRALAAIRRLSYNSLVLIPACLPALLYQGAVLVRPYDECSPRVPVGATAAPVSQELRGCHTAILGVLPIGVISAGGS